MVRHVGSSKKSSEHGPEEPLHWVLKGVYKSSNQTRRSKGGRMRQGEQTRFPSEANKLNEGRGIRCSKWGGAE